MSPGPRLVLASASPRRRELLAQAGLEFEVRASHVDESLGAAEGGFEPRSAARLLAERKARAVASGIPRPDPPGEVLVLGADTVVALVGVDGSPRRLLGKPESAAQAAEMLGALSGTRHAVVTGLCVVRVPDAASWTDAERTWVSMRALSRAEIEAYVASGEWRDKAGGYAIQETAEGFVTALEEGGFDNVVGLPVARTLALLEAAGWPGPGGLAAERDTR